MIINTDNSPSLFSRALRKSKTVAEQTIFVVDDDERHCESIQFLLSMAGYRVETFNSPLEILRDYDDSRPGCVLLDVSMPEMEGDVLQQRLKDAGKLASIVFVTAHAHIPSAVSTVRKGAIDYLEKPYDKDRLLSVVQKALAIDAKAREDLRVVRESQARIEELTPREREVFELVVVGKANKNIAADLGIAVKTVELHRSRVMKKTGADSVPDLVKLKMQAENGAQTALQ